MGRKGKAQKHTAAEIAKKHKAAKEARGAAGGGGSMAAARKTAGDKVSVLCEICKVKQPNFKSMTAHFESKHPKNWDAETKAKYEKQFDEIRSANKKGKKDSKSKGKGLKGGKKAEHGASHLGF